MSPMTNSEAKIYHPVDRKGRLDDNKLTEEQKLIRRLIAEKLARAQAYVEARNRCEGLVQNVEAD